jgi:hypothetical protein
MIESCSDVPPCIILFEVCTAHVVTLEFEITEGVLLEDTERNLNSLRELKKIGISIALARTSDRREHCSDPQLLAESATRRESPG